MTSRERVDSQIVRKIVAHYAMIDIDIQKLYEQILSQLTTVYRQTIARQLILYSCQKTVTGPDSEAFKELASRAKKDSEGIAKTYNTQLSNKVNSLYQANKKGNRFYYIKALESWLVARNAHKIPSISLNTMTSAREYAAQRFRDENGIEGRFVLVGPPPVCKVCMKIKALGPVTLEMTKKRRLPAHVNCPHRYEPLVIKKIDCDTVWTG